MVFFCSTCDEKTSRHSKDRISEGPIRMGRWERVATDGFACGMDYLPFLLRPVVLKGILLKV